MVPWHVVVGCGSGSIRMCLEEISSSNFLCTQICFVVVGRRTTGFRYAPLDGAQLGTISTCQPTFRPDAS